MPATTLDDWLRRPAYQAYSYAYPHKSAYRRFDPPVALPPIWQREPRDALFLYLHIPFCSHRCGFCNLFAMARPAADLVDAYVDQMIRQLRVVVDGMGPHAFARLAIGGGTPTYLTDRQLGRLLEAVARHGGFDPATVPSGIEASPETVDAARMRVVRAAGIDRVSMGVQSFSDAEVRSLVRPQQQATVDRAIACIRAEGFPTLNLDLIYGIAGQSVASFVASIESALAYAPEEIYLYPLYVREQTGLARITERATGRPGFALAADSLDDRARLYAQGRDRLLEAGYTQVSMRLFRAAHARDVGGPAYCCQQDGMLGIGCGARSYTRSLHYSSGYAVRRAGVAELVEAYVACDDAGFREATHGFQLDGDEQRRRHAIQSLLVWPGFDLAAYRARFGTDPLDDLPQLSELLPAGLAREVDGILALTAAGMARADTLGPWLYSSSVATAMREDAHD